MCYEPPERTREELEAEYEEHLLNSSHALEDAPESPFELDRYIHTPEQCWAMRRPRALVPDLMFERSVGIVISEPHVGKTLMLLDFAIAMATGQPWIDWQPQQAAPALVYALDSPSWESCEQARNLMAGRGIDPRVSSPMFAVACREQTRAEFGGSFDILNSRHFKRVVACATGMNASLIGFDSLSKLHTKDENTRADMEEVMRALELLASMTGAHVTVMHHTPVGGRQQRTAYAGRGSSVIAASVDLEIHLWKKKNGNRVMDILKARGSDIADNRFELALERVSHPEVPRAVRWIVVPESEKEAHLPTGPSPRVVIEMQKIQDILSAGPLKRKDLVTRYAESVNIDYDAAYRFINTRLGSLAREGRVIRECGCWRNLE